MVSHLPIVLHLNVDHGLKRNSPFRFQAAWLIREDFPEFVKQAWFGDQVRQYNLLESILFEFNSKISWTYMFRKNKI